VQAEEAEDLTETFNKRQKNHSNVGGNMSTVGLSRDEQSFKKGSRQRFDFCQHYAYCEGLLACRILQGRAAGDTWGQIS